MEKVEDIHDKESLKAWLGTQPREVSALIASRAALRVMPVWTDYCLFGDGQKRDLTPVVVLRMNLISSVAAVSPTDDMKEVARAAARAARAAVAARADAAYAAYAAAAAAADAARAVYAVYAVYAADAAAYAAVADDAAIVVYADAWRAVRADARAIEAGEDVASAPLWPGTGSEANPLSDLWHKVASQGFTPDSPYDFWHRWYETLLDPTRHPPMPFDMLKDIALIAPKIWEGPPEALAAEIARIEAGYKTQDQPAMSASRIEQAIARTPYGERVEVNPVTGKLEVLPESDLPQDIVEIVKRKLAGAVAIFDGASPNQYTGCAPELDLLREMIEREPVLPVELFDTCTSVVERMKIRVNTGDIPSPEQDPLVADFLKRVREAGMDIYANNPKTREMVAARNAFAENNALIDAREGVQGGAEEIEGVSQGVLQHDMPGDADLASNKDAPPEDRKQSSYRLVSRVVKIALIVGAAAAGTVDFMTKVAALAESSWFMALLNAALRYIGL